jgi:hypothetical protein
MDEPAKEEEEEEEKEEKCSASSGKRAGARHARARTPRCSRQRDGAHFTKHEIETLHAVLELAFHKEQAAAQAPKQRVRARPVARDTEVTMAELVQTAERDR